MAGFKKNIMPVFAFCFAVSAIIRLFFCLGVKRPATTRLLFFLACLLLEPDYAQAIDPAGWFPANGVVCAINTGTPINFGTIEGSLVKPVVIPGSFQGDCKSISYRVEDGTHNRVPEAAFCLTVQSQQGGSYNARYLYNTQDPKYKIPFNFYRPDQSSAFPIGDGTQGVPLWARGQGPYNPNITGPVSVPLDWNFSARLESSSQTVPPGVYSNTFMINLAAGARRRGDYPNMNEPFACGYFPNRKVVGPVTVTTTVKASCNVNIEKHIDFGKYTRLAMNIYGDGRISVRCSDKTKFQVGINSGLHSVTSKQRYMRIEGGGLAAINYNLFHDRAGNKVWTDEWGTPNVLHDTGSGTTQYYDVYAIVPAQPLKPYGSYSDVVRVEVRLD